MRLPINDRSIVASYLLVPVIDILILAPATKYLFESSKVKQIKWSREMTKAYHLTSGWRQIAAKTKNVIFTA